MRLRLTWGARRPPEGAGRPPAPDPLARLELPVARGRALTNIVATWGIAREGVLDHLPWIGDRRIRRRAKELLSRPLAIDMHLQGSVFGQPACGHAPGPGAPVTVERTRVTCRACWRIGRRLTVRRIVGLR